MFRFQLTSTPQAPTSPRTGEFETSHGAVETPVFMPVGTLAAVKTLLPSEVAETGAQIILVNAYHLYLRPGHELIDSLGGVHRFMQWHGPILSDSGGFQVFSLDALSKVTEEGLHAKSHIDGSPHLYTPELAMEVQRSLGVDIAMPLDHLVAPESPAAKAREAAERTIRWYERCRESAGDTPTFAIVQGGVDPDLRRWHARSLLSLDPPGFSIGGLSVGESKDDMWAMTALVNEELPVDRPRYLMGVGSPEDLVNGVARGVDMFDCVLPTRLGRNGALFIGDGRVNITNAHFAQQDAPVDDECDAICCREFSAAYLHHLFRNTEMLGYRLATIHNIRYLVRLMDRMRGAIREGDFDDFAADFLGRYRAADPQVRAEQRAKWERRTRQRSSPGNAPGPGG